MPDLGAGVPKECLNLERTVGRQALRAQPLLMILIPAATIIFLFRADTFLLLLTTGVIVVPRPAGNATLMITREVKAETHRATTAIVAVTIAIALFSVVSREYAPSVVSLLSATQVKGRDRLALIRVVVRGEPSTVFGGYRERLRREIDRYRLGLAIGTTD